MCVEKQDRESWKDVKVSEKKACLCPGYNYTSPRKPILFMILFNRSIKVFNSRLHIDIPFTPVSVFSAIYSVCMKNKVVQIYTTLQ